MNSCWRVSAHPVWPGELHLGAGSCCHGPAAPTQSQWAKPDLGPELQGVHVYRASLHLSLMRPGSCAVWWLCHPPPPSVQRSHCAPRLPQPLNDDVWKGQNDGHSWKCSSTLADGWTHSERPGLPTTHKASPMGPNAKYGCMPSWGHDMNHDWNCN